MMIDSDDYVGINTSEKDDVAIINTDMPDAEADQLHDLPTADDCTPPLPLPTLRGQAFAYPLPTSQHVILHGN